MAPSFQLEFRPLIRPIENHPTHAAPLPRRFRVAVQPPEIQILARTQEQADVAALLLYASHSLIDGCLPTNFTGWDPYVAEPVQTKARSSEKTQQTGMRMQFGSAVDVAGLAVRLARRRPLTDAAFYFLASVYSVSSHPMDLHPRYGDESITKTLNPMHRVWEAQALFAAYQAIEALQLTVIGASSSRPSIRDKTWDPEIRKNLESRLTKIGIAENKKFLWLRRGSPTSLHRQLSLRTSTSNCTSWSQGRIRDENIPYVDAINRAQWLRSNTSAHKSSHRLHKLHPIDALNVQHLARMLIMNSARFPWWQERKPRRAVAR